MVANCLQDFWYLLLCLLLIIHLQQENSPSAVSCISVAKLEIPICSCVQPSVQKMELAAMAGDSILLFNFPFCWKGVPVILKVSSVGVPVAVHREMEFGIEFSPQFGHRAHVKPILERVIFWDLCTPLCIMGWRFPDWLLGTVPRAELPEPQLNRVMKDIFSAWSIFERKNRPCSVTKKADLSRVTSLFLLEMIMYF